MLTAGVGAFWSCLTSFLSSAGSVDIELLLGFLKLSLTRSCGQVKDDDARGQACCTRQHVQTSIWFFPPWRPLCLRSSHCTDRVQSAHGVYLLQMSMPGSTSTTPGMSPSALPHTDSNHTSAVHVSSCGTNTGLRASCPLHYLLSSNSRVQSHPCASSSSTTHPQFSRPPQVFLHTSPRPLHVTKPPAHSNPPTTLNGSSCVSYQAISAGCAVSLSNPGIPGLLLGLETEWSRSGTWPVANLSSA